jgi:hypothetical protein
MPNWACTYRRGIYVHQAGNTCASGGEYMCIRRGIYVHQAWNICASGVEYMCIRHGIYVHQAGNICASGVEYMCIRRGIYVHRPRTGGEYMCIAHVQAWNICASPTATTPSLAQLPLSLSLVAHGDYSVPGTSPSPSLSLVAHGDYSVPGTYLCLLLRPGALPALRTEALSRGNGGRDALTSACSDGGTRHFD